MPEQHVKAGAVDKAEEVLDVVFPSGDESPEAVHPGDVACRDSLRRVIFRAEAFTHE